MNTGRPVCPFSVVLGMLLAAVIVASSPPCAQTTEPSQPKVLILGAGMAGVACAEFLLSHGHSNVLLLEAEPVIGGRVREFSFSNGLVLELGANWIEGLNGNPLIPFVNQLDINGSVTDFFDIEGFDHTFKRVPNAEKYLVDAQNALEEVTNLSKRKQANNEPDISLRAALDVMGHRPKTPFERAAEWTFCDYEFGDVPLRTSLKFSLPLEEIQDFGGDQMMITDQRGYSIIIQQLAKELKARDMIKVNVEVAQVHWNESDGKVRVLTSKNELYEADYVVSTFSLGVLQEDTVKFIPAMPEVKREAIYMYEMIVYTKLFMRFPENFWGDREFLLAGFYKDENVNLEDEEFSALLDTDIWYFQNLNKDKYFKNSNVLMATFIGDTARKMEIYGPQKATELSVEVLSKLFGFNVSFPLEFKMTSWSMNPHFSGSYSNAPIGVNDEHWDNLRAPLNEKVYFAGECFDEETGYVHSAYRSGRATAQTLLKILKENVEDVTV